MLHFAFIGLHVIVHQIDQLIGQPDALGRAHAGLHLVGESLGIEISLLGSGPDQIIRGASAARVAQPHDRFVERRLAPREQADQEHHSNRGGDDQQRDQKQQHNQLR